MEFTQEIKKATDPIYQKISMKFQWSQKTILRRWRGLKKIYDRIYSKTKYLKIHTLYDLRTIRINLLLIVA